MSSGEIKLPFEIRTKQNMEPLETLKQIVHWYAGQFKGQTTSLVSQFDFDQLDKLQTLLGEKLPPELEELLRTFDGETKDGLGSFLGHEMMSAAEISTQIHMALETVKPEKPRVIDHEASERFVGAIADIVFKAAQDAAAKNYTRSGVWPIRAANSWHKATFGCSSASLNGPYLYLKSDTKAEDHIIFRLDQQSKKKVYSLARDFSAFERKVFGWDELEFEIFRDGRTVVERRFFDLDSELPLTSHPANAIKQRYMNEKWVPVIHDGGNNFIGVDLDPGPNGTKEQVIVFGRDEDDRFVVAESWPAFLTYVSGLITRRADELKAQQHLHDIFRKDLGLM